MQQEVSLIRNLSTQTRPTMHEIEERLKVTPYKKVIEKLNELKLHQNPLKKAKIIGEAREYISVSIDEFWRGIDIKSDRLMLDAD